MTAAKVPIILLFLTAGLAAARPQPGPSNLSRFTFIEYLMGVDARLVVYAPSRAVAETACRAAFERIADLDAKMSDYRPDSELMRLCDKAGGPPVAVSQDLLTVLRQAKVISSQSDGMFDVTIGPLVKLWRVARKTHRLPSPNEIGAAKALVDWRRVEIGSDGTVRLPVKGMRLDLGAIGKGYACDAATSVLRSYGLKSTMVDMGDIVLGDPPPGSDGWSVEVPNGGTTLHLANCAVSASGDTVQFVDIGGKRYSHVVDPHTGYALTNRVQATVVAPTGILSDPLSTAATLLDEKARKRLFALHPEVQHVYVQVLRD